MKIVNVKLLKPWGGRKADAIVALGEPKAASLIAQGIAEASKEEVKAPPVVETATIEVHAEPTEMAVVEPVKKPRGRKWTG